jgi:hypothetical protein
MREWPSVQGVARLRDVGPLERRNAGDAIYAVRLNQSRAALALHKGVGRVQDETVSILKNPDHCEMTQTTRGVTLLCIAA